MDLKRNFLKLFSHARKILLKVLRNTFLSNCIAWLVGSAFKALAVVGLELTIFGIEQILSNCIAWLVGGAFEAIEVVGLDLAIFGKDSSFLDCINLLCFVGNNAKDISVLGLDMSISGGVQIMLESVAPT